LNLNFGLLVTNSKDTIENNDVKNNVKVKILDDDNWKLLFVLIRVIICF